MRKERKHFTLEEKVAILRRHLVDKVPVSELCEVLGLRPTMFYRRWLFCREECKQRDSNHAKDHNVLGTILPVHPVRHGLRRLDCHREPMGKA